MATESTMQLVPPALHDWQCRVQWELRPLAGIPEGTDEVVLKEIQDTPEKWLVRVLLPSGKVLQTAGSVLLEYCHALQASNFDIPVNQYLHLTYFPATAWSDASVEEFFSALHREEFNRGYIQRKGMYATDGALILALDVPAARGRFREIATSVLRTKSPAARYHWLSGWELVALGNWKPQALAFLAQVPPDQFRMWLQGDNRRKFLEAFNVDDILTLAYTRCTRLLQQRPSAQWDTMLQQPETLSEVVLDPTSALPPCMRLKVVISDDLSIVCKYQVLYKQSLFVRNAIIDEDGPIPTVYLPFAVKFPRSEILAFFAILDSGEELRAWKPSWVHLADYLQMPSVLDAATTCVWRCAHLGNAAEWLATTRLQSMQQRRPRNALDPQQNPDICEAAQVIASKGDASLIAVLAWQGEQFVELLGMDRFLDLLETRKEFVYLN